jgi:hypothetical protein
MLSCSCDNDDAEWFYDDTKEVAPLATKRMRRCCSCKERISVGDDCKPFPRWRNVSYYSDPEVLVRIYGDGGEFALPTWYLCDRCAGLYESLDGLGFCGMLGDNLVQTCREYGQMQRDAGVFRGQMVLTPNDEFTGPRVGHRSNDEQD